MRISDDIASFLHTTIKQHLPDAQVFLFGSRTDNAKRGGDIDILVLANRRLSYEERGSIKRAFWKKFGERKIDLVSYTHDQPSPFKDLIFDQAIPLP